MQFHKNKLMPLALIISLSFCGSFCQTPHALCYYIEPWRRLGDAIMTVTKTLYFSQLFNLPIYYTFFPYFDDFLLSQNAQMLPTEYQNKCAKIKVNSAQDIENNLHHKEPILFEVMFLTQTPPLYTLMHNNLDFARIVKQSFTPLIDIPQLAKPPAVVTVGLHVRKGGGFDRPLGSKQEYTLKKQLESGFFLKKRCREGSYDDKWGINWPPGLMYIESVKNYLHKHRLFSDYIWPIKFPCDQYYIDQLKELYSITQEQLLVYLFTDDPDPEQIIERYSAQLKEYPRIIFSYRKKDNHHTKNVIEDLFSLIQCDCIISANSSFATVAQFLGDHKILMFPLWACSLRDKIIISKIGIIEEGHFRESDQLQY